MTRFHEPLDGLTQVVLVAETGLMEGLRRVVILAVLLTGSLAKHRI